jgi:coatomer subunit delta
VPIEKMTLVLITTKQSNIIEDLEVLRQLNQVVVQLCNSSKSDHDLNSLDIDEKTIISKSFDLILSFDDVVSLGYRESVTMPQLEAYLEMDSTDEKIYRKQQMIREAEAREQAKRVQKELARKRAEHVVPDKMKSMSSTDFQPAQPMQEPGAARQQ